MRGEEPLETPSPIEKGHDVSRFDCGAAALNDFLRKYAFLNHQSRSARTYATTRGRRVVGYYILTAGSVRREETPGRVARGLGQ